MVITFCYLWLPYMILPIYAGLERIPSSVLEASADLGGRGWMTFRRVVLPLALPAVAAGSIFTFSLTLGDYVTPQLIANTRGFIGNVVFDNQGVANNVPFAAAFALVPIAIMAIYLLGARRLGAFDRCDPATGSDRDPPRDARRPRLPVPPDRGHRLVCVQRIAGADLADRELQTEWFGVAFENEDLRDALGLSIQVGLLATAVAIVLGTLAALALHRFTFFGRDAISFLFVLPIALPGIVTGMALSATIDASRIGFSAFTIAVGHATFCIVVVFNNVIARLRRSSRSIEEASMDLGADAWQTFRYVTFPMVRTALLAGGLLAFALSFDEVVVTRFTAGTDSTLPIWIFTRSSSRPSGRS